MIATTVTPGPTDAGGSRRSRAVTTVGAVALIASVLYLVSDAVEVRQGGFSPAQLWLTLAAEAAVPCFVLGLAWVQQPRFGRLGALSALAYAYAFVFFSGTVVYALVDGTPDYDALTDALGTAMLVHGAVMVTAGLVFGYAVHRARVLPAWTGPCLMFGVVLVAVTQTAPDGVQLAAAAIRDLAFAGMGASVLLRDRAS